LQSFLYSSQILINLENVSACFKSQIPDLLKIQWECSCSMRADGQIDMKNSIAASPSFANTP